MNQEQENLDTADDESVDLEKDFVEALDEDGNKHGEYKARLDELKKEASEVVESEDLKQQLERARESYPDDYKVSLQVETETVEEYSGDEDEPYKTSRFEKLSGPEEDQPLDLTDKIGDELEDPVPFENYKKAIEELTTALVYTAEYVGQKTLTPIRGWSWFDALVKYAPEKAAKFRHPDYMEYEITIFDEVVGITILEMGAINSTGLNAILKNLCGLNQHHRDIFMRELIDSGHNTLQGDKSAEDLSRYTILVNRTHI